MKKAKTVMVISDLHIPHNHKDSVKFLEAVKKKYKPDYVIINGDEIDSHSLSFHTSDPDLANAGDELIESIEKLKPIYKLFPNVDLVHSNHGSMVYRKGKHHGIPRKYLRDYGDVLDAPKGWKWYSEIKVKSGDNIVKFRHQWKKNVLQAAQAEGFCLVQSHFHEDFSIAYAGNSNKLIWAMTIGSLVDDASMAFEYNKTFAKRPILGIGMIINGQPKLIPMVLTKNGRWNGEVN